MCRTGEGGDCREMLALKESGMKEGGKMCQGDQAERGAGTAVASCSLYTDDSMAPAMDIVESLTGEDDSDPLDPCALRGGGDA